MTDPARITIRRRVEWVDTDAAGIYHWMTAFRLAEAAEAALHTALGIVDATFGVTPRLHVSCDFHKPLRFNDLVDVHLEVSRVGRTSLTQRLRIEHHHQVAAEGEITMCLIKRDGRASPWPHQLRTRFEQGGQQVERFA
jgi:acyl-CoA thioesterase FadM